MEYLKNIDKKKICYVLVLVGLFIILMLVNRTNNGEEYIKGNKKLYDVAMEYLKEEEYKEYSSSKQTAYKRFYSYDGFGITENSKYKYAYMWILGESYYLDNDNKIASDSGYSMFFKFTFKDGKVKKYENPKDGGEYTKSVKKMSIDSKMSDKILKYNSKLSNEKEVKKYYEKFSNPKKLTKRDIINDDKLLFTIDWKTTKCVPVSLNVYEDKYVLYNKYKECKKKLCDDKLEYTKKESSKYTYDVIKIIKNSKNADLLSSKELKEYEYEITTGKADIVGNMVTDSNNKYLKEFLKKNKLDLNTCAKGE